MKNTILMASFCAVIALYAIYFMNEKNSTEDRAGNVVFIDNNTKKTDINDLSIEKKLSNKIGTRKPSRIDNITPAYDTKVPMQIPQEMEWTSESRMNREEQFIINQEAELEVLETTLALMVENDFPDEEIEMVKDQIDHINSQEYVDELEEGSEYSKVLTLSEMRENLSESLKETSDLSDEEREQMVYSIFPDEELASTLETEDTSAPPHAVEH